jgi:sporulation-control protein
MRKRLPFVQEFEFVPSGGLYAGKVDEIEIIVQPSGLHDYDLFIEVDRRARGFGGFLSEMLDADESLVHVHVSEKEIPQLKNILTNIISRYS